MRPVMIKQWNNAAKKFVDSDVVGNFAQYGVDYEEFESGPGNFSTAIVEMSDGRVENIPLHRICFLDRK